MSQALWPAPAKINLFLHVLGRRADGYHRLQTLFQFLDYGDTLSFCLREDGQIRRSAGPAEIPEDSDLAIRAARALRAACAGRQGADIAVTKRTPTGAGLGGGSSDAATVLVALNRLWDCGLATDRLAAIGLTLGADVPVFVHGLAAWAEGVGEQLTPVQLTEPWYVVLVPPVHVATAAIFGAAGLKRDSAPITLADYLAGAGHNDCTPVTCEHYPLVAEALRWLQTQGYQARMSGTGGAVFAACRDESEARATVARAPSEWRGFAARGLNVSPLAAIIRAA
jgi:4-diphosphocytidyl-2-C-methyl-D-erythritol kinase